MHCEAQSCSKPVNDLHTCDTCSGPRYCSAECKHKDAFHQYCCSFSQLCLSDFEFPEDSLELGKSDLACVHSATSRRVRLKRLSKEWLEEHGLTDSVMTTIRLHHAVFHPHVLRLFGFASDEMALYLVLEDAPNGSLAL